MTEHLRIGTGVSLAALYHPTRLAEEVALLDVLSGGRVNWGAGRGFDAKEFEVFGVPREESYARFRENVDIVLRAWGDERLDYDGRFHQLRDVEVLPKPLQKPHPPVWIASSSPEAIEWSAREGHAILMDPHSPARGPRREVPRLSPRTCGTWPRAGPGHPDGAADRDRRDGPGGGGGRPRRGALDGRFLRQPQDGPIRPRPGRNPRPGSDTALRRRDHRPRHGPPRRGTNCAGSRRSYRLAICWPPRSAMSRFCASPTR